MPRNLINFFCLSVKCVDASLLAFLWHNLARLGAILCHRKIKNNTSGERFCRVYLCHLLGAFRLLVD